jgi:hypothetical protein
MIVKKLFEKVNNQEYIQKWSPSQTQLNISNFKNSQESFVDPVSIAAIIEGVKLLLDLFGLFSSKKESDISKIGDWAKEIAGELSYMNKLLVDIKDALRDLKIYIDENQTRVAESDVLGKCHTYIDNVEYYKLHIENPLVKQEILNMHESLQNSVRTCMRYGYAPAFTISYAYMVEIDLIKLFANNDDSGLSDHIIQVSNTYASYIELCLNNKNLLSFNSLKNNLLSNITALEKKYTEGEKGLLPRAPYYYKERCRMVSSGGGHDRDPESHEVCDIANRYNPAYRIKGDIKTGFSGETYDCGSNYGDSSGDLKNYINGFAEANRLANVYFNENVLPEYNLAVVAYSNALNTKEAILKAIDSLTQIKSQMLAAK